MKTAILLAVAIVIFSSLPFVSRQTNAAAQENAVPAIGARADSFRQNSSAAAMTPAQTASTQMHSKLTRELNARKPNLGSVTTPSAKGNKSSFR
jgi:hypothetical protein